jgi:hypothetical protein
VTRRAATATQADTLRVLRALLDDLEEPEGTWHVVTIEDRVERISSEAVRIEPGTTRTVRIEMVCWDDEGDERGAS